MKITIITGSPHKNGTSSLLADEFIRGAKEKGHEIFRFDAAFEAVHSCLGCDYCSSTGHCIHKDSIEKLIPYLKEADIVVFVTPLYYFGMSAQLKIVIDRFYAINDILMGSSKKAILLSTAYDNHKWTFEALEHHYKTIVNYLGWKDIGILLAGGCGNRSMIEHSSYPEKAYEMGKKLK